MIDLFDCSHPATGGMPFPSAAPAASGGEGAFNADHVARIRQKLEAAEGIGPFWKGVLLGALQSIDAKRYQADKYGVTLMAIREGCEDPRGAARDVLAAIERHQSHAG